MIETFAQEFIRAGREVGHSDEYIAQLAFIGLAFGAVIEEDYAEIDSLLNEVPA